jgi:hypothetical protein
VAIIYDVERAGLVFELNCRQVSTSSTYNIDRGLVMARLAHGKFWF